MSRTRCEWCGSYFAAESSSTVCDPCRLEYDALFDAFTPWAEIAEQAGDGPSWLLSGYLAAGHLTLLAGKPKAGKSTLACEISEAVDNPETTCFLERCIGDGPVVFISEEGSGTLAPKLSRSTRSVALTREGVWPKPSWPALIAAAVEKAEVIEAALLVIDSLSFWASFREGQAKDSGAAQEALSALTAATNTGLAVLLVHHQRKAGGGDGDAVRDSNAIVGAVDVLIELEKLGEGTPDGRRRLVGVSRWDGKTPPVLVLDRDAETGRWQTVGHVASREEASALGMRDRILAAMPDHPVTEAELVELVGEDKRKVGDPLRALVERGRVSRTSAGKRGNPYRYEKVSEKVSLGRDTNPGEKVSSPRRGDTFTNTRLGVLGTETDTFTVPSDRNGTAS